MIIIKELWFLIDDDKSESCAEILEELETIDDDTDKHGIQFVKSNDAKLAAEIGVFSFPALVYYETGVPIMYDGKYQKFFNSVLITIELTLSFFIYSSFFFMEEKQEIKLSYATRSPFIKSLFISLR